MQLPSRPAAALLAAAVAGSVVAAAVPARAASPHRPLSVGARQRAAIARSSPRAVHGRNRTAVARSAVDAPGLPGAGDTYDVVSSFAAGKLLWHDLDTGARGAFPQATGDFNAQPVISPDGQTITYDSLDFVDDTHFSSGIAVFTQSAKKAVQLTNFVDSFDTGARDTNDNPDAFSPDGQTIYYDHTSQINTEDGGESDPTAEIRSIPITGGTATTVVTEATSAAFTAAGVLLYAHTNPTSACFLDSGLGTAERCVLTRAQLVAALPSGVDPTTVQTDTVRTFGTDGYTMPIMWGSQDSPHGAVVVGHGASVRTLPATVSDALDGLVNVDPTGTEVVYAAVAPDFSSGVTTGVDAGSGTRLAAIEAQSDEAGLSVHYGSVTGTPSLLHPVTPTRVLDTRTGLGTARRRLAAGTPLDVKLAGVPAGATAVVGTLTAVNPTASAYVSGSATPAGPATPPLVSPLQSRAGTATAVLDTIPVGAGGAVRFAVGAGTTDLVFDLAGWYVPVASGGSSYVAAPASLGTTTVRGSADLPLGSSVPTSATAVVLDLVTTAPAATYVGVAPAGAATGTSTANLLAGETRETTTVVAVPASRTLRYTTGPGSVTVDARVVGYYTSGSGAAFVPAPRPYRTFDSRTGDREVGGAAPVAAGTDLLTVGRITTADGTAPVGPGGVVAALYGLGGVRPSAGASLLAAGDRAVRVAAGTVTANAAYVPVSSDGTVRLSATASLPVIADLEGWFVATG